MFLRLAERWDSSTGRSPQNALEVTADAACKNISLWLMSKAEEVVLLSAAGTKDPLLPPPSVVFTDRRWIRISL